MGEVDSAEPTELAPTETDTASVRAWGLDEYDYDDYDDYDEPPTTRITPGRITGTAVTVSLIAISAVGVFAWMHLRTEDAPVDAAVTSTAAPMTTTVVPVAAPEPKPPTVGWGVPEEMVPPPTKTVTVAPSVNPADEVNPDDARFVANLKARGWNVWDPNEVTGHARTVCAALRNGDSPASVNQQMVTVGLLNPEEAASFTATAMVSYPNCP